jgi:hypothetical protein
MTMLLLVTARGYDNAAKGLPSYFVWLNRDKQSLVAESGSGLMRRCCIVSLAAPTCSSRTSRLVYRPARALAPMHFASPIRA